MPQLTDIEWTASLLPDGTTKKGYSSNPIRAKHLATGNVFHFCTKVSAGCGHCYSESLSNRFGAGLPYAEKHLDEFEFVLIEKELQEIIKLNARLAKHGETAKMFIGDMTDIFQASIPDEFLDRLFAVFALCPNITFQVLTKRGERMRDYFKTGFPFLRSLDWFWERNPGIANNLMIWATGFGGEVLPNVWLGVSVENQTAADERIPHLLDTPAAVRFLSCEPLLAGIDLMALRRTVGEIIPHIHGFDCLRGSDWTVNDFLKRKDFYNKRSKIDWTIIGGESGAGARPCAIEWIRAIVRQCEITETPVFVKQLGSNPTKVIVSQTGLDFSRAGISMKFSVQNKKGGALEEFPSDLQIREFPKVL